MRGSGIAIPAAVKQARAYLVAIALTAAATLLALVMDRYLAGANDLSLVYIVAVVLAAIRGGTRPALTSAGLGFLALNYFFTEPRGTLLMVRQDDVVTVVWFLLVAVVVGRLAAALQEKLRLLQGRERFGRTELELMQRLAVAIRQEDVMEALLSALRSHTDMQALALPVRYGEVDWSVMDEAGVDLRLRDRIGKLLQSYESTDAIPVIKQPEWIVLPLLSGNELIAFILLECADRPVSPGAFEHIEILIRQATLALGRTRLAADLSRERFEKDRELLRSSLLSSISHDFRTPLTAMTGAASTLLEMGETLPAVERRELLESIINEARRLDDYTQNLLDMTRLGSGNLHLERNWISIDELTDRVENRIRPHLEGIALHIENADDIPLLHVHAALLEQALFNVLHNALKFSPPGSSVSLRSCRSDERLIIEVEDKGPGIPERDREVVFDMFHSAAHGDRRAAGSGLGLAICRGMIGAHGGTVSIHDGQSGSGCLVRMTLPLAESAREVAQAEGVHGIHSDRG